MMISRMKELPDPGLGRKLKFLGISVEPDHDSPEVLQKYRQKRGLPETSWVLATATRDEVTKIAKDVFKRPIEVEKQQTGSIIFHAEELFLVRKNKVVGAYNYNDPRSLSVLKSRILSGI